MLFPNFKEYCVAFLMETVGYWRLGTTNWIVADGIVGYGDTYGIEPANLSDVYKRQAFILLFLIERASVIFLYKGRFVCCPFLRGIQDFSSHL